MLSDKCYITFLSSDNYIYYILALYDSFKKIKSNYPLYCAVTEDVSEKILGYLDSIGLKYIKLDGSDIRDAANKLKKGPKKYINALSKLSIFNLTQFSKCVYLDSDLVIKKNIDELFKKLPFTAVEDCLPVHKRPSHYVLGESSFNSGMFVFEPSSEYYKRILDTIPKLDSSVKWHDQAILYYLNKDWMQRKDLQLPYTYNTLVAMQEDVLGEIRRQKLSLDDVKVFHYVTYKNAPYSKETFLSNNVYKEYYAYFKYINECIDKFNLDLEKIHLENVKPIYPEIDEADFKSVNFDIDMVICWVNNNEPVWKKTYERFCRLKGLYARLESLEVERYDDAGFLKYLFRGIEKNMPWIRKVHLVVSNIEQVPSWINQNNVHIVLHKDIIADKFLPTFNSTTIEMYLRHIPDLAEHFIYANDDMYTINYITKEDFFSEEGYPRVAFVPLKLSNSSTQFDKVCWNNEHHLLEKLEKEDKNRDLTFKPQHTIIPYRKSTLNTVIELMGSKIFDYVSAFRTDKQHNQYIYANYERIMGTSRQSKIIFEYHSSRDTKEKLAELVNDKNIQVLCINDVRCDRNIWHKTIPFVKEAFEKRFPDKCKYEV